MIRRSAQAIYYAIPKSRPGNDLGRVCGMGRDLSVLVTRDARSALSSQMDVVLRSISSSLNDVADQLLECLEARAHVVSTCEELAYPFRKRPELSKSSTGVLTNTRLLYLA